MCVSQVTPNPLKLTEEINYHRCPFCDNPSSPDYYLYLQIIIYIVSRPGASSDFVFPTEQPLLHIALKITHISRTYMLFKAFIAPTTETYTHTFDLYSFVTPLTFPRFLPSSKYLTSRHPSKYWRNNQGFTFRKYIFEKGNVVFIKTH